MPWARCTWLPIVTGPIIVLWRPMRLSLPIITSPTALLMQQNDSMTLRLPSEKRLYGGVSIRTLRCITECLPLCWYSGASIRTYQRGLVCTRFIIRKPISLFIPVSDLKFCRKRSLFMACFFDIRKNSDKKSFFQIFDLSLHSIVDGKTHA